MNKTLKANSTGIKRIRLILFIAVFLLFAFIGFILFQQFTSYLLKKNVGAAPTPVSTIYVNQGNFLFIHTDQLNSGKPGLISVWAIFISKSNPPSLIAKSIFPDMGSPEKSQQISKQFSYSEKNGLSNDFVKLIRGYDWQWNGYMIVDNESFLKLAQWINGKDTTINIPTDTSNPQSLLDSEKSIFQDTCKNLIKPDTERGENPHWQDLIPIHLQTDLFFKDAALNWDRITFASSSLDCKVLVTP